MVNGSKLEFIMFTMYCENLLTIYSISAQNMLVIFKSNNAQVCGPRNNLIDCAP